MTIYRFIFITWLLAVINTEVVNAETDFQGFGSIAAGIVTSGDRFLSNYPNAGIYDDDLSFSPDTTIGLQLKTTLNDKTDFVIQLVNRGASDFDTDIDWAYINYSIDHELSIQAGRKRLPLYFYSDFFDLGLAYHWIRPPADNYTWQITSYNGVNLQYEAEMENWDMLLNVYIGREDDKDNELLTFLASNNQVDETWKNIVGVVAELSDEQFELRFTVMTSQLDRYVNNVQIADSVDQLFYGFSVNYTYQQFTILSELNHYERADDNIYVDTSMMSLAYKIKSYTPHITYSKLRQDRSVGSGDELHSTYSIGCRKDLNKTTALKLQFDKTTDKANTTTIVGDGELLSFGIDFVF